MINGLISPSSGEIFIDGADVATASPAELRQIRRNKIAMVFQHFALFPHKTVGENVAFGLKIRGMPYRDRRERALTALDQVGLKAHADTFTEELSGGMQQRVGLARALATRSDVLLMDEPFSALDPLIRRDMQRELIALQHELKKTIIFITHDLDEALILGDRIAIMKDGRIVQIGTAKQIVDEPADDYVVAFIEDIDRARVLDAASTALPPEALEVDNATVATAIRRMEDLDRDALYLTEKGKPVGVISYRKLVSGGFRPGKIVSRDMAEAPFPTASGSTPLRDLFPLAGSGLPIALIDDRGRLTGVIHPATLLEQLAPVREGEDGAAAAEQKEEQKVRAGRPLPSEEQEGRRL
jgi:glycine betaine/proline transport system ATP-binding protein